MKIQNAKIKGQPGGTLQSKTVPRGPARWNKFRSTRVKITNDKILMTNQTQIPNVLKDSKRY
jgi:hypothetical protein